MRYYISSASIYIYNLNYEFLKLQSLYCPISSPFWQNTVQHNKEGKSLTICLYSASIHFRKPFLSLFPVVFSKHSILFLFLDQLNV